MDYAVEYYEKDDGSFPAEEFILFQDNIIGKKVILINGFVKKTQRTPFREIERAKRYRDDYLQREGINNGKEL